MQRDSNGGYAKAGTSFEFTRLLTGEISIGYAARNYVDPRLERLQGMLTTVVAGLDGDAADHGEILFRHPDRRDHAARHLGRAGAHLHRRGRSRFPPLADGIGKFTYGTLDYQGDGRNDKTYSIEGDLIYKLTRNLWIKGTLRHDILDSNVALARARRRRW